MNQNPEEMISLTDYLMNVKKMYDLLNFRDVGQRSFDKENKNFSMYDSNMSSVGYARAIEEQQNYKLEIIKLKQQEAKSAQLIAKMQKQIELFEKMTQTKADIIFDREQAKNASDLQIQAFQKQWEADKDQIMMKFAQETKSYKMKIKQLLGQLKELQLQLQESKKGRSRIAESTKDFMKDSMSMNESTFSLKENNNIQNKAQGGNQLQMIIQENLELKKQKYSLEQQLKEEKNGKQKKIINSSLIKNFIDIKKELQSLRNQFKYVKNTLKIENKNHQLELQPFLMSLIQEVKSTSFNEANVYKKQYLDELKLRKRFYNEIQEMKGNIRVTCRMRPLLKNETNTQIQFQDENSLKIEHALTEKIYQFDFDKICNQDIKQHEFFEEVKPLITSLLDGYNVCIFAYGATGTGKTYTMQGTPDNQGVFQRTIHELFKLKTERQKNFSYTFQITLLEIYNENIRDLLCENQNSNKKLEIKIGQNGNYVPDITTLQVQSPQEVQKYLEEGSQNRSVGKTNLNEHSSRSHLIYTIMVQGKNLIDDEYFHGKLHLIDLAGSERLSKSKVQGDVQKESICINKSLSALSDVISARSNKNSHIPFRNSTLTYFLQDSLSGDSKTHMILQISPSDYSIDETISSLKFAQRVKQVELGKVKKNVKSKQ